VLFSTLTAFASAYRGGMSTRLIYSALGVWFTLVAVIAVLGMAAGVPPTLEIGLLVLVAGVIPPASVLSSSAARELQLVTPVLRG
jgi:hypothetical protein